METCKQFYEQIIAFDELNQSEQIKIKSHMEECAVCRKHLSEIKTINSALKQFQSVSHLSEDDLIQFGLYLADPKHSDYDGAKFAKKEISVIHNHVEHCRECRLRVEQIKEEYAEIELYLENEGIPDAVIGKTFQASTRIEEFFKFMNNAAHSFRRFLFPIQFRMVPVLAVTLASLLIIIWFSPLFRGEMDSIYHLATIQKSQIQQVTRSIGSQLVNDGFTAFNQGDYKTAITILEKYIQSDSVALSLAYVHKCIGIAYLFEAKQGFLGRLTNFDADKVNRGMKHLQTVLDLTDNIRLQEDAFWYLGKAHLMKNEIDQAKDLFSSVIKLKGRNAEQAEIILAELEKY